jgi:hypothetical protein
MLAHLAENRGNLFARNPDAARITLTSLIATGTTLDDLLGRSNCETFLLYALAGEMYVEPSEKNWAEPLATSFLRRQTQAIDSTSHDELEALFFCVANRSDTIDQQDLLRVRSTWMERVPQFESLLAEGIRLGETINQRLADNKIDAIRFSMKEGYQLPYAAKQKGVVQAMKRSVETLIQLTRKTGIEFADASDSLEITLKLEGEPIDEYRKQILEWRSQYKTKGFRSLKTGTWYRSGSWVDRAVPSGESRIERVFGTTVSLDVPFVSDPIQTGSTLAYWSDILSDKENDTLDGVGYQDLSGRVWPLGIHESYFLSGKAVASTGTPQ